MDLLLRFGGHDVFAGAARMGIRGVLTMAADVLNGWVRTNDSTTTGGGGGVGGDRAVRIAAAINGLAQAEGVPVSIRHVGQACADAVDAIGAAVYLVGEFGLGEPLYATDPVSERITELQVTLGEGPATMALEEHRPILEPDLAGVNSHRMWPLFGSEAVAAGVLGVFAFPLTMGAIAVGALEIYRPRAGSLSAAELDDAFVFSDMAMQLILDAVDDGPAVIETRLLASDFGLRWAEVHQAVGMVSAQLDSEVTTAFLRLRAHAFRTSRRLLSVADDVVTGRLRFDEETIDDRGPDPRDDV